MAPCKFAPMRHAAKNLLVICLLSGAAHGDSEQVEQITLDISDSLAVAEVKDGRIYSLNGVKVRVLEAFTGQAGFQRLPWDGRDEFGDQIANGAYLYHFRAELDGQTITRWGRLARLR